MMEPSETITPRHAIARVEALAAASCGPLGTVHFEFIPLPEGNDIKSNWDLAFRPAPSNPDALDEAKAKAIQLAVERVRVEYPMVRWP